MERATFNAFAGMAYEAKFGRFFARPEGYSNYLYLSEGERKDPAAATASTRSSTSANPTA